MNRTCLISSALALTVLAPTVVSAEPGVLYIPTEPVTLTPFNEGVCGSQINSALGCDNVDMVTEVAPFADAADLTTAMSDALVDYDVMVTNTRPVDYLPYLMLMASDEPSKKSQSLTCTGAGINCGSRQRNDIGFTRGTTMNCMDPEVTHASMYAFGRMSGLEGVVNPEDWMNYLPDYTMPPVGFIDDCFDRANQLAFDDKGNQVEQQLECTSLDHFECPDGMNGEAQQNTHQDLLMYYGARTEDADPPVFSNILPEDGTVLTVGDNGVALLEIDVDIADADPAVAARWTITSDALISDMFPDGILSICTNDICSVNWEDVSPAKATDSDWASPVALNFPPGEYAITLEASDYHGNVAEMVSFTVTIEGDASDTGNDTGQDDTAGGMETGNPPPPPPFTTGQDSGDSGDTDNGDGGATDDGGGCSCRTTQTPGGMVLMLLGLMGLGAMRRRW
jgi:MYXO-CTERM domain-containing protein